MLQSHTTPGQYHILQNANIPRADVPPSNQTEYYRAILHQVSITYCRMPTYPGQMYPSLIKLSATEPNYTRSVSHIAEFQHTQGRCIPLLIKLSATEPFDTRSVSHIAECQHTQCRCTYPLLIKLIATEPNYTRSVSHIAECRHTQERHTPAANLVLQSPMTPGQFHIWKNTDIPDQ